MKEILYNNGFLVVDNFLQKETCDFLRESVLNFNYLEDVYFDYNAVNYSFTGCKNKNVSNLVSNVIPDLLKQRFPFLCEDGNDYQGGWYLIHDNHQLQGVGKHRDPGGYITANLWVTPEEYLDDTSEYYNGLVIHILDQPIIIPYKFNRLILFFSQLEHEAELSRFQSGKNKRKVNFTFIFGPPLRCMLDSKK